MLKQVQSEQSDKSFLVILFVIMVYIHLIVWFVKNEGGESKLLAKKVVVPQYRQIFVDMSSI